jgi:hypothetical protein
MERYCVNASSIFVLIGAVFCSGCIAEEADLDREDSGTVEAAHVTHHNDVVGSGVYHPTYAVEYYGSDGRWWAKHNLIGSLTSLYRSKDPATKVCHQQGVWQTSFCKAPARPGLDSGFMAQLRAGPYWKNLSDTTITQVLSGHTLINNHYSHPDTLGFDANDSFIVRFDIPAQFRTLPWYNAIVELDVAIPNQQACTTTNRDLIPHVEMEVYWYHCRNATHAEGCANSFIGAAHSSADSTGQFGRVGGVWNSASQTCTVRANVRIDVVYDNPNVTLPYAYFFKVAAVGGIGHLPAPVKVRLL